MELAVALLIVIVIRARRAGSSWYDIISSISKFFNFLIGGSIKETFSARVGRHRYNGDDPEVLWYVCSIVVDFAFKWREADHCEASRIRKIEHEYRCVKT